MVNWFVHYISKVPYYYTLYETESLKLYKKMKADFKIHPITEVTFNLIRR